MDPAPQRRKRRGRASDNLNTRPSRWTNGQIAGGTWECRASDDDDGPRDDWSKSWPSQHKSWDVEFGVEFPHALAASPAAPHRSTAAPCQQRPDSRLQNLARPSLRSQMAAQPAVPIIVGVGDVRNKSSRAEDAMEPAQLMADAVGRAVRDSGLDQAARASLLSQADSLRIVPTWTWAYNDLPAVVSRRLGIEPTRKVLGEHGGNQPALQCDEAARDIAARRSVVSVLTGGEALASRKSCPCLAQEEATGQIPPKGWLEPDPNGKQLASLDLSILEEGKS
ncbi:thiolase [Metarhizium album ARSEF 1941]|uniref:Thiolase n=1 Tax=Metarhizium album (strain ARSEF 1941) TaxID=1081103 RepID=A0A0B2WWD2_METAS|nr:thiolase [Metarhizium album ARSEF 1941]KHN98358.1 thiolase [Metarhizium album ARSEF 1941]